MVVLVRRYNVLLIVLIFIFAVAIFGLNYSKGESAPAAGQADNVKTVLLDPGHGGEDPGAVSDYSGAKEKDLNLVIALKVKALLEQEGYRVLMTRSEDRLEYEPDTSNIVQKRVQDLLRRKKMMDECGANISVSIHMNKFGETQYYGAQTFYPPKSPESQKLAASIQRSLKEMVDPDNKREANEKKEPIIIFKDPKSVVTVVECGFLSNSAEEKKLVTEEYQTKLSEAIKDGIVKYFQM